MSREHAGWVVWGLWLVLFCSIEAPAAFWGGCPWPTFSTTTMSLQARWDLLTVPIVAILAILFVHLPRFANIKAGELGDKVKDARIDYHVKKVNLYSGVAQRHAVKTMQLQGGVP